MNQDFQLGVIPVIHPIKNENKKMSNKHKDVDASYKLSRTETVDARGLRRISIIGLFQPLISFIYGLVIGGVKRSYYIKMMEQEAQEASESRRMRVIVQDNGPIHRCREVQALWTKWESQGLYMFFLPKYCSEMNPIELEWQHLKRDEIAGKMFEDELELAYAVIDGVETRGKKGKHRTERTKFNKANSV